MLNVREGMWRDEVHKILGRPDPRIDIDFGIPTDWYGEWSIHYCSNLLRDGPSRLIVTYVHNFDAKTAQQYRSICSKR